MSPQNPKIVIGRQYYNSTFTLLMIKVFPMNENTRFRFKDITSINPSTILAPVYYALLNCSFRKNAPNPIGTANWKSNVIQNHADANPSRGSMQKFGNTLPGPILSGAVARPTMVASEPSICAAISVKRTWKRVKVWRRIIPKPEVVGEWVS